MASLNDSKTIANLIKHKGLFFESGKDSGDAPIIAIFQYNNMFNGGITYKICWTPIMIESFWTSPYCLNKKTLWTVQTGVTEDGKKFIEEHSEEYNNA